MLSSGRLVVSSSLLSLLPDRQFVESVVCFPSARAARTVHSMNSMHGSPAQPNNRIPPPRLHPRLQNKNFLPNITPRGLVSSSCFRTTRAATPHPFDERGAFPTQAPGEGCSYLCSVMIPDGQEATLKGLSSIPHLTSVAATLYTIEVIARSGWRCERMTLALRPG